MCVLCLFSWVCVCTVLVKIVYIQWQLILDVVFFCSMEKSKLLFSSVSTSEGFVDMLASK